MGDVDEERRLMKVLEDAVCAAGEGVEGVEERLMRVGGGYWVLHCALASIEEDLSFVGRLIQRFPVARVGLLPYGVWTRPPHQWDAIGLFLTFLHVSRSLLTLLHVSQPIFSNGLLRILLYLRGRLSAVGRGGGGSPGICKLRLGLRSKEDVS